MSLLHIINEMRDENGQEELEQLDDMMHLRDDLELDSFMLAELTVRLEDEYDVDIFADGIVQTVGEVRKKLERR